MKADTGFKTVNLVANLRYAAGLLLGTVATLIAAWLSVGLLGLLLAFAPWPHDAAWKLRLVFFLFDVFAAIPFVPILAVVFRWIFGARLVSGTWWSLVIALVLDSALAAIDTPQAPVWMVLETMRSFAVFLVGVPVTIFLLRRVRGVPTPKSAIP